MGRRRAGTGIEDAKERVTIVADPGYKKNTLDPIADHFGMNYSDLGKHAIAELWRRKEEPSENRLLAQAFDEIGLVDMFRDFRHANFEDWLERPSEIRLHLRELTLFTGMHRHGAAVRARAVDPTKKTTLLISGFPSQEHSSGYKVGDGERHCVEEWLTFADQHSNSNFQVAFAAIGHRMPTFLIIADTMAVTSGAPTWEPIVWFAACPRLADQSR